MKNIINILLCVISICLLTISAFLSKYSISSILNIFAVVLICALLMRIFKLKRLDELNKNKYE